MSPHDNLPPLDDLRQAEFTLKYKLIASKFWSSSLPTDTKKPKLYASPGASFEEFDDLHMIHTTIGHASSAVYIAARALLDASVFAPDPSTHNSMENAIKSMAVATSAISNALDAVDAPSRAFRFMDLPPALRVKVYGYLVLVGKVYYTPDRFSRTRQPRLEEWYMYKKPDLSILRVSKMVHQEAEELYFSRDLFVLPNQFKLHPPFLHSPFKSEGLDRPPLFSDAALGCIRSISVDVSPPRRPDYNVYMDRESWDRTERSNIFYDNLTAQQRMEMAHENATGRYQWEEQCISYVSTSLFRNLKTIEIEFTDAYCPLGCCRTTTLDPRGRNFTLARVKEVRILGLRNEKEKQDFMQSWSDVTNTRGMQGFHDRTSEPCPILSIEEIHKRYRVVFGNYDDQWKQWKSDWMQRRDKSGYWCP